MDEECEYGWVGAQARLLFHRSGTPAVALVTARRDNYFRSWARPHKVCISPATFRKKGHLIHCKPASRARNSPCHDRHPYAVLLRRIAASSALIPKPGERRSHVPLY